jgi:hypothetical protein
MVFAVSDTFRSVMLTGALTAGNPASCLAFEKKRLNGRRGSAGAATTSSSTSPDRFKKLKEATANEGEREMRQTPAG